MSGRSMEFRVQRYRPEQDSEPFWQTYRLDCREEWVVLDALNHIKDHIDGSLSYRWSCHMAVCGSCGVMVNGRPELACKAFLRDYPNRIRIAPLANLAIERDLITDQDRFMDNLARARTWLIPRRTPPANAEYRQQPEELARFRALSMCINCQLCYAACPQVGINPDYPGPAVLALAQRYNLDSRDGGKRRRAAVTASDEGVWECTFVGECSHVCPKQVEPAAAIQQMKLDAAAMFFRNLLRRGELP